MHPYTHISTYIRITSLPLSWVVSLVLSCLPFLLVYSNCNWKQREAGCSNTVPCNSYTSTFWLRNALSQIRLPYKSLSNWLCLLQTRASFNNTQPSALILLLLSWFTKKKWETQLDCKQFQSHKLAALVPERWDEYNSLSAHCWNTQNKTKEEPKFYLASSRSGEWRGLLPSAQKKHTRSQHLMRIRQTWLSEYEGKDKKKIPTTLLVMTTRLWSCNSGKQASWILCESVQALKPRI